MGFRVLAERVGEAERLAVAAGERGVLIKQWICFAISSDIEPG